MYKFVSYNNTFNQSKLYAIKFEINQTKENWTVRIYDDIQYSFDGKIYTFNIDKWPHNDKLDDEFKDSFRRSKTVYFDFGNKKNSKDVYINYEEIPSDYVINIDECINPIISRGQHIKINE